MREKQQFDVVLAADTICYRLDAHDPHSPLLSTVRRWLKPDGLVLVMGPRDHRLENFMKAANQGSQAFGFVGQSLEFEGAVAFRSMKCGPVLIKMTNPRLLPHQESGTPSRPNSMVGRSSDDPNRAKGKTPGSNSRRRRRTDLTANDTPASAIASAGEGASNETDDTTLSGVDSETASTSWSALGSCSLPDVHAGRTKPAASRRPRTRSDAITAERCMSPARATAKERSTTCRMTKTSYAITAECSVLSYARTDSPTVGRGRGRSNKPRNRGIAQTAVPLQADTVFRLIRAGGGRSKQKYVIGSRGVLRGISKNSVDVLEAGLLDSSSTCFLSGALSSSTLSLCLSVSLFLCLCLSVSLSLCL